MNVTVMKPQRIGLGNVFYETTKNWTGECIRLENVNTYKEGKTKPIRKQLSRGKLITIERMNHWKHLVVIIYENGTENIVKKWAS